MATILHLIGDNDPGPALSIIAGQLAAGDTVTVAIVGSLAPALPPGPAVLRVPDEASWEEIVDLIFTADQTLSW